MSYSLEFIGKTQDYLNLTRVVQELTVYQDIVHF